MVGCDAGGERDDDGHEETDDAAAGHQGVVGGALSEALAGPAEHTRRHLRRRRRRWRLPVGVLRRRAVRLAGSAAVRPAGGTGLVTRGGEAGAVAIPVVRARAFTAARTAQLHLEHGQTG